MKSKISSDQIQVFLFFIFVFSWNKVIFADPPGSPGDHEYRSPTVLFKKFVPPLDSELRKEWHTNFFDAPEVLFFQSRADFDYFIASSGLEKAAKGELQSKYKSLNSDNDRAQIPVVSFPLPGNASGYVFVPNSIRKLMSTGFLQGIYSYQHEVMGKPLKAFSARTPEDFLKFASPKLSPIQQAEFKRNVLSIKGDLVLPMVPFIWTLLSEQKKDETIEHYRNEASAVGYAALVVVTPESDLEAMGRFFAGQRDPAPLIRYLKYLRSKNKSTPFNVPLEDLLHPFIRKTINTFSYCDGPNCHDAGRNTSLGNRFNFELIDPYTLLSKIRERYLVPHSGERLRPGDLLVYRNADERIVHTAVFAVDGFVFTKNGAWKLSPYIFQPIEVMEDVYVRASGPLDLTVYRGRDPETLKKIERSRPLVRPRCNFKFLGAQKILAPKPSE